MAKHFYVVSVEAESVDHAALVMLERLSCDEDYGFPYTVKVETWPEYDGEVATHLQDSYRQR